MWDAFQLYGSFDHRSLGKAVVSGSFVDSDIPEMRMVWRNLDTADCKCHL